MTNYWGLAAARWNLWCLESVILQLRCVVWCYGGYSAPAPPSRLDLDSTLSFS